MNDPVITESQSCGVTVTQLHEAMQNFVFALLAWEGEDHQQEMLVKFVKLLPMDLRANLVLQAMTPETVDPFSLSMIDKRFALELANQLGADWAQWNYHMAVLVTKLVG